MSEKSMSASTSNGRVGDITDAKCLHMVANSKAADLIVAGAFVKSMKGSVAMLEKEYIEREAVLNRIQKLQGTDTATVGKKQFSEGFFLGLDEAEIVILQTPTADVAEVKHGEWELYFDGKELMCSVCKATFWDECGNGGTNYCPNCGAKMDGGKNG